MMNAVHDLALLVARDEGLFRLEGLDVEIVTTPGTAQVDAGRQALQEGIFDRTMESLYNDGGVDQYRMCEWITASNATVVNLTGREQPLTGDEAPADS